MKTAVIAGATGLVGGELLGQLLASERYSKVAVLTRRDFSLEHPKLQKIISDLSAPARDLEGVKPDDIFCCLGTTMAKAGTKDKFYNVDFEMPLALALATRALGAKQYLLVSAVGANRNSSIYYNRVKGEVEDALRKVGFEALHIFRPSLILGPRKEKRAGEDAAKAFFKVFGFLIPSKYKGIESGSIARAMLVCAARDVKGVFIHESNIIPLIK